MTTFKDVLCLLAIFVAYGIVGRLDYEDAVGLEQIIKERHHADCLMTTPADQPYGKGAGGSKYQGQRGPTPSRYFENFKA